MAGETGTTVQADALRAFCVRVFEKLGLPTTEAEITTDVLLAANLRGIDSHGVARLRRYVKGLQDGVMLAQPEEKVVSETATTALIDAGAGLEEVVDWHVLVRWEADGRSRYGMLATTAEFGRARAAGPEADLALPALRRRLPSSTP